MKAASSAQNAPPSKGERTRGRIIEQALALIEEQGIAALSQEGVARRAGLSQSALRHHFPMKEDMLQAIFAESFQAFYRRAEQEILRPESSPREKLVRLIRNHLDYIARASDRIALESFAYSSRDPVLLEEQTHWYAWLAQHYAVLLEAIRPDLGVDERRERAFALLTLCLGAWISAGKSRPSGLGSAGDMARDVLLRQAERLIDA